jgi:hypothetical protein
VVLELTTVNVDDYAVFVTDIRNRMRKLEDFCLKAEVGASQEEFIDAFGFTNDIKTSVLNLENYMRIQMRKQRK